MISCSTATAICGCQKPNKSKTSNYTSYQQAEKACNSWQKKGGTWELKVNDFRISASDTQQQDDALFPIKVATPDQKAKEDLTSQKDQQELTVYLPLLTSGKDRSLEESSFVIETIGEKWLKYDRRLCRNDETNKNIILGKEYSINSGERVFKSNIPELSIKRTFAFTQ